MDKRCWRRIDERAWVAYWARRAGALPDLWVVWRLSPIKPPVGTAKKSLDQAIGLMRTGLNTKIHAVCDALGNPLRFVLTPKQRHDKYLNNIVEQEYRAVKRITRPRLGVKSFKCAARLITGIETMHRIKKGRCIAPKGKPCLLQL